MTTKTVGERLIAEALRKAAGRRGLSMETFGYGWVIRLSDGERVRHVLGYDFDLNPAAAARIAGDKAATAAVLAASGVPCIEHRLFLRPDVAVFAGAPTGPGPMHAYADTCGWDVVVKSNIGTGGAEVFRVSDPDTLDAAVTSIYGHTHAVTLSPFVPAGSEHRMTVLDGRPVLVYEKVPARGEWRHNLGLGASAVDVADDAVRERLGVIALETIEVLGLRFASVDVMTVGDGVRVLEVNGGVMMEHYGRSSPERRATVFDIYDQAVAAMFE